MRHDDCQKLLALIDAAKDEFSAAQCEIDDRKERRVKRRKPPNGNSVDISGKGNIHVNSKTPT
jgi:hypothetical protein